MAAKPASAKAEARALALSTEERSYLQTGADVALRVTAAIDRLSSPDWGIVETGIPSLDARVTIGPKTVTVLAARPSHGKSMLLKVFARNVLARIKADGAIAERDRLVYITLEESVVKVGTQTGAFPYPWRTIQRGEIQADELPAARAAAIGLAVSLRHLVMMSHPGMVDGRIAPAISAAAVIRSVERMVAEDGIVPRAIFLDYLQLLGADGSDGSIRQRSEAVTAASHGAVRLAHTFNCPVVMAVQASRDVDTRAIKIPTMSDLQHASAIEQDADTVIGLWRPSIDYADELAAGMGRAIPFAGRELQVTSQLMLAKVVKSRDDGAGGLTFALNVDPVTFEAWPIDPTLSRPAGPSVSDRIAAGSGPNIVPIDYDDEPETW